MGLSFGLDQFNSVLSPLISSSYNKGFRSSRLKVRTETVNSWLTVISLKGSKDITLWVFLKMEFHNNIPNIICVTTNVSRIYHVKDCVSFVDSLPSIIIMSIIIIIIIIEFFVNFIIVSICVYIYTYIHTHLSLLILVMEKITQYNGTLYKEFFLEYLCFKDTWNRPS